MTRGCVIEATARHPDPHQKNPDKMMG